MKRTEVHDPQVHDLLQIDHASLSSGCAAEPPWVRQTMLDCPWVVVRRSQAASGFIAVGVRGDNRNERWAASCEKSLVREIVRPEELLPHRKRCTADAGTKISTGNERAMGGPDVAVGTRRERRLRISEWTHGHDRGKRS